MFSFIGLGGLLDRICVFGSTFRFQRVDMVNG